MPRSPTAEPAIGVPAVEVVPAPPPEDAYVLLSRFVDRSSRLLLDYPAEPFCLLRELQETVEKYGSRRTADGFRRLLPRLAVVIGEHQRDLLEEASRFQRARMSLDAATTVVPRIKKGSDHG